VDEYLRKVPLERLTSTDDVAAAVLFLVSPAAQHITGVEITVDGGASLGGMFKSVVARLERIPGRVN
jgi:NAD(P)-dependent dehydrogenase (short-subunit alcohol dehydrogenase family)